MATLSAKYAFSNLALSAKLHKLLGQLEHQRQARQHHQTQQFDDEIGKALHQLERKKYWPVQEEVRTEKLRLLRNELEQIETLFASIRAKEEIPAPMAAQLEETFENLREKIREKEFVI